MRDDGMANMATKLHGAKHKNREVHKTTACGGPVEKSTFKMSEAMRRTLPRKTWQWNKNKKRKKGENGEWGYGVMVGMG